MSKQPLPTGCMVLLILLAIFGFIVEVREKVACEARDGTLLKDAAGQFVCVELQKR